MNDSPEKDSAIDGKEDLQRLARAVALSNDFQFLAMVVDKPLDVRPALDQVLAHAGRLRGRPFKLLTLDPYAHRDDPLQPVTYQELVDALLEPLLGAKPNQLDADTVTVIDASKRHDKRDRDAWIVLFQRMNELRNNLAQAMPGSLLLVAPSDLKNLFAERASDFWSVRSAVAYAPGAQPPAVAEQPAPLEKIEFVDEGPILPADKSFQDRQEELRQAADDARERFQANPEDIPAGQALAVRLMRLGKLFAQGGFYEQAEATFAETEQVQRGLLTLRPRSVDLQRDLADALWLRGWVLMIMGRLSDAADGMDDALKLLQSLHEAQPQRPDLRLTLARTLLWRGELDRIQGNFQQAFDRFLYSKQLLRDLLVEEPNNPEYQRDLSVSLERVGDVHRARGDLERALAAYEESLEISRKLLQRDPDLPLRLRNLSVSLNKVGDVHHARGDLERALAAYEEGLEIRRKLLQRDHDLPERLRDLAVSHDRMGRTLEAQGRLDESLVHWRESYRLVNELKERFPDVANFRLAPSEEAIRRLERRLGRSGDV